jgi:tetraacyldisaccharide 4'-kinase
VIDGPYGIGNGWLIPAGPLREPFTTALARADALIIIGEDSQRLAAHASVPVFHAQFLPVGETSWLHQHHWLAFAGIGRPEKFFTTLRNLGISLVQTRSFPDHHTYSNDDLVELLRTAEAMNARLITTEKDAVKLSPEWRKKIVVLPISLAFFDTEGMRNFLRRRLA